MENLCELSPGFKLLSDFSRHVLGNLEITLAPMSVDLTLFENNMVTGIKARNNERLGRHGITATNLSKTWCKILGPFGQVTSLISAHTDGPHCPFLAQHNLTQT